MPLTHQHPQSLYQHHQQAYIFFFNDTATTEIYTLSLHDALPISWQALARNSVQLLQQSSPHGFAPDWAAWKGDRFVVDPVRGAVGGYDAIRCYTWAGMTAPRDPLFRTQLAALSGPLQRLQIGRAH